MIYSNDRTQEAEKHQMIKSPTPRSAAKNRLISWIQYVGMVLAFIGAWQVLSSSAFFLRHLL